MKKNSRWLVILLVVLGGLVVGLTVWIVVLRINSDKLVNVVDIEWKKNIECFENGAADDISVCIDEVYDSDMRDYEGVDRSELVAGLYNKAIDNAISKEDWTKARELMVDKPNFFILNNDCDKAMRLVNESQVERLNDDNKGIFYSYALDMSISCDDEENIARWADLLNDYNEGVKSGFGF